MTIPALSLHQAAPQVEVSQDLTRVFDSYLSGQMTDGTRKVYRRDLLEFFGGQIPTLDHVRSLRPEFLLGWRNQTWNEGKGMAAATINRKLTVLSSFYNHLMAFGLVQANPAHGKVVKRIKEKRQAGARLGITREEMSALLAACTPESGRPADVRDYTLISVLYTCLLRRGEAERILWRDICRDGGRSLLHLPITKGGTNDFVPIEQEVLFWLDRYFHALGGAATWVGHHGKPILECPVFLALDRAHYAEALSANGINEIIKKRAKQAQIQEITAHYLRHSGVSHLLMDGHSLADVQALARHSDPKQTVAYALLLRRLANSPGKFLSSLVGRP